MDRARDVDAALRGTALQAWSSSAEAARPGAEVFRSDRQFRMWAYSATHSQLLLRSAAAGPGDQRHATTVELRFTLVHAVEVLEVYDGLAVRYATEDESRNAAPGTQIFVLESQGHTGVVACGVLGWREGVLSDVEPSLFNVFEPDDGQWPAQPLAGVSAGAERFRDAWAVLAVAPDGPDAGTRVVGVFLTEQAARAARAVVKATVERCWIAPTRIVV